MLVERVAVRGRSCQCAKNAFVATQEEAILCIVGQVERGVVTALLACIAGKYEEKHKGCNISVLATGC